MTVIEKIQQRVIVLPETRQAQVLDFIEFLLLKSQPDSQDSLDDIEKIEWSNLSLTMAMRGIEDEEEPTYTITDLKETF